jgi:hypothetical protein
MRDFSQLDLTLANKKIDDESTLNKIRNGKKKSECFTPTTFAFSSYGGSMCLFITTKNKRTEIRM